jgi:phosphoethanolamine N-methyltransferase
MSEDIQYPEHFTKRLHLVWGDGFLSPGGPEEVSEIIKDVDLTDRVVLDVGFGTGGPAIHLASSTNVAKVVGIDIEPQLRDEALSRAERAGVKDKVEFQIVEPGDLPFLDESFDIVFSKDSIIHITDKSSFYAEVERVLKPGGRLCASDWLGSSDPTEQAAMETASKGTHLHFDMVTAAETEATLRSVGFVEVSSRDRNAWYADLCRREIETFDGPLYKQLVDAVGSDIVDPWIEVRKTLAQCAISGGLRPTHIFGRRPK